MNVSSLVALLQNRAMHHPDRVAYRFLQDGEVEIGHLTYAALDAQARAIGAALQSRGALGQRVLLLYSPGLEFIVGFFGCLYGGAIAVPTYLPRADQSLEKLAAIAGACQAKLAVTTGALLPMLAARFPEQPSLDQIELIRSILDWVMPIVISILMPRTWHFCNIPLAQREPQRVSC
jgi:acyl-CoA synthetase (AMP-forming)/AMP-acid ligase II